MQKIKSKIKVNYDTVRITKSRIEKGLLAIPVSLKENFPQNKGTIKVLFDDRIKPEPKSYTPFNSSSRECRIGGLANWFARENFKEGDEVVIQFVDILNGIYRLRKENNFIDEITSIENSIISSAQKGIIDRDEEPKIRDNINKLSKTTNKPINIY